MRKKSINSLTTYVPGTCNTIDDETGFKVKLSEVSKRWDGAYVTKDNWEERQPQDFPITPRTQKVYANARSEPEIIEYTEPDLTTLGG